MMETQHQGFKGVANALTPFALGVLGVLLLTLPVRLFGGLLPVPIFPIAIIFYWSLISHRHLPPVAVFAIGVLHDLISGSALGVWTSVYILTQYLVIGQRAYFLRRDSHVIWMGFTLACFVAGSVLWLLTSLLAGSWVTVGGLLVQFFVTILVFPILFIFFNRVHQRIIVE